MRKFFLFPATVAEERPYRLYVSHPLGGPENFLAHLLPGHALHGATSLDPTMLAAAGITNSKDNTGNSIGIASVVLALQNDSQINIEKPSLRRDGREMTKMS
ncbi:hypothetical protein [Paraburkholderia sediminicola]|uniref:hypothetical protein n=1 Tax=Paraburkholderia sediminicola TaxID=458836 RepID=UPI0038B87950